ncbi:MAG: DUF502 domain-containing protein [Phycisphaeraceae bacterium]|nr:DUF502 domain-containing protein [Phycisphaeraceae bacterium]
MAVTFTKRARNMITAGLVLILPIWASWVLVAFLFRLLRDASLWAIEALLLSSVGRSLLEHWGFTAQTWHERGLEALPWPLRWSLAGAAVVLTVMLLYLLGAVATNILGRRLIGLAERLVDRLPLIKTVYRASKQVLEMMTGESARPFTRVVLVPFPGPQTRSIGFVTRPVHDPRTGQRLLAVLVATTPNPTTGFLLLVADDQVVDLDWTVEEAFKTIMSGGVLMPPLSKNNHDHT